MNTVSKLIDNAILSSVEKMKKDRQQKQAERSRSLRDWPEIKPLVKKIREIGLAIGVGAGKKLESILDSPNAAKFVLQMTPYEHRSFPLRKDKKAPFLVDFDQERIVEGLVLEYIKSIRNDKEALRRVEGNEKFLRDFLQKILGANIEKGFRIRIPDKRVVFYCCYIGCYAWIRHPVSYYEPFRHD